MMVVLLFAISLSGLSFLLSITKGYSFEEVLPSSIASKILILFLFGICGWMKIGIYAIALIVICEYGYGIIQLFKEKKIKKLFPFFSCGFFCWIFAIIVICWCMYGKMFDSWDEFSHWGDIVKVMATLDDFGTNPLSFSWFKSYPPGMSLFQYYLQKINFGVSHIVFEEWLVYVAYQVFTVSFIIPIICKCKRLFCRPALFSLISIVVIFAAPLMFGQGIYRYLYIDPVLGVLFACGLVETLYPNDKKDISLLYIISVSSMLVLAKDAGLLFSIAICIAYGLCIILDDRGNKEKWIQIFFLLLSLLPKLLWRYHLSSRKIKIAFSGKYDFEDFVNVITYKKRSYRTTVYDCFKQLLFTNSQNILGFSIHTYILIIIILVSLIVLLLFMVKKKEIRRHRAIIGELVLFSTSILYIVGMLLSYMYKFSEGEAVYCASFIRYIDIIYESIWMVFTFVFLIFLSYSSNLSMLFTALFAIIILIITPNKNLKICFSRSAVHESVKFRESYYKMTDEIMQYCDGQKVFLISQGDTGLDLTVLKFSVRPNVMNNNPWSFGKGTHEGDIYTYDYSIEQIQAIWKNEDYKYVALYSVNSNFIEQYKGLFEEENIIKENSVYKINEYEKLELCD